VFSRSHNAISAVGRPWTLAWTVGELAGPAQVGVGRPWTLAWTVGELAGPAQVGALRAPSCAGPTRWNSPAGALSGDRPTV
jgi:hypothetical protein